MTETSFRRGLGLFDSTNLVIGSMIGSGIFIVSADIARQVGGGLWVLVVWAVAAAMTVLGAASYGELASMFPAAGGQYVFLRESFGRLPAFLYGWTLFMVIQTGTLAAVAVAFAKFLGVLVPSISSSVFLWYVPELSLALTSEQAVAVAVLVVLTLNNCLGLSAGKAVQNVFTVLKVATLLGVIAVGLVKASPSAALRAQDFSEAFHEGEPIAWVKLPVAIAVALVGALFSSDAWNNVTFAAGEVREPERTVPRALLLGTAVVTALYFITNVAYLNCLSWQEVAWAPDDRVGTALMRAAIGPLGSKVMAALVMVSTFGCLNGMILAGPRLYYAMARDGVFFPMAGRLSSRSRVPVSGLLLQGVWASVLALSGTYGDLLDYVICTALFFYALSVIGVFRLRRLHPGDRPFRAPGYPVLPGLYVLVCLFVMGVLLVEKPDYTWPGFLIVAAGAPVFLLLRRRVSS